MQNQNPIFSPPLEANSLFLRITKGCSYNQCSFCGTYRDVPFQKRPFEEIQAEAEKVTKKYKNDVNRIFLGDGDALVADMDVLYKSLALFNSSFPNLQNVGIYATPRALLDKTPEELAGLREKGLHNIYMGLESGSDKVLTKLKKGITAAEIQEAGQKAVVAGFKLSTLVILGAGGRHNWRDHATATGKLVSAINPQSIIMLTLVLIQDTPLFEEARRGTFTPPTPVESVLELKEFISCLEVSNASFRSKHSSNFLKVSGELPGDKEAMLHQLERILNNPTEEFFDPAYFRGC
ncbi:MAG: radical SAM protein [Planctomycetota bacterium]